MNGMVNKAVQELITHEFGESRWLQIRQMAGVEDEIFVSTEPYPDEITYRLVAAASEVLGLPSARILEQLGRWWVLQTAQQGYGHLMKAAGRTLADFLVNLPNFHTRIEMMYPGLRPPEFECTDILPGSLKLHYRSHRKGLAPFVTGMLQGLGEMFATAVQISAEEVDQGGGAHHVFHVSWKTPPEHAL
jgi:hypothetical protein